MLSTADHCLQGYDPDDTWLEIALKIIKGLFKEHIICSPSDSLALVFFGTVRPLARSRRSLLATCSPFCGQDF